MISEDTKDGSQAGNHRGFLRGTGSNPPGGPQLIVVNRGVVVTSVGTTDKKPLFHSWIRIPPRPHKSSKGHRELGLYGFGQERGMPHSALHYFLHRLASVIIINWRLCSTVIQA